MGPALELQGLPETGFTFFLVCFFLNSFSFDAAFVVATQAFAPLQPDELAISALRAFLYAAIPKRFLSATLASCLAFFSLRSFAFCALHLTGSTPQEYVMRAVPS